MRTPFRHQAAALAWALRRPRIALFWEMRLGKSLVAMRWAKASMNDDDAALIITPSCVVPAWLDELDAEEEPNAWLAGSSEKKRRTWYRAYGDGVRWFIITPEGLRAAPDLCDNQWHTVIVDESHCMANPKAAFTKMVLSRLDHVEHRAILTGTPAAESMLQYFTQIKWINGSVLGHTNYWSFVHAYFHQVGFDWRPNRGTAELIRQEIAEVASIKSLKDVGLANTNLYTTRYAELAPPTRRLYKQVTDEFACGDLMTRWMPVAQNWLSQIAGGCLPKEFSSRTPEAYASHKFKLLEELLTGDLRRKPVVVYFRYNRELQTAYHRLKKLGVRLRAFTGLTAPTLRRQIVTQFQCGTFDVLLAQAKAARYGLNFSRATASIVFSNYWDWVTRDQLEARMRHPLRKEPCLYLDLCTNDTVDELVLKTLRRKERDSDSFLQALASEWRRQNG